MDEPSFDREIIAKNPNVPQCGVSDIANGKDYCVTSSMRPTLIALARSLYARIHDKTCTMRVVDIA
jgi:hypothetical protein